MSDHYQIADTVLGRQLLSDHLKDAEIAAHEEWRAARENLRLAQARVDAAEEAYGDAERAYNRSYV